MKAVLLHGAVGHPFENWFPWLGRKLIEEKGWQVRAPQLPTPEGQNKDNWLKELDRQAGDFIDQDTVLIGHSCGAMLVLNYLSRIVQPIAGSVLVSPAYGLLTSEEFTQLCSTFCADDFDWDLIIKNAGKMVVYHSDDDPYVPLENVSFLEEKLGLAPVLIPGGGHLNSAAGYDEFPALYSYIQENFC